MTIDAALQNTATLDGAIFDLGGVVFGSPLIRIHGFESDNGLAHGTVAKVIAANGDSAAWHRHERGEIDREVFLAAFSAEFRGAGVDVDVTRLLDQIEEALSVRPAMLAVVDQLRDSGVVVAALTNNWTPMGELDLASHFDVFVESVVEGCRKPEVEIYRRTLDRMQHTAATVAMIDDIGGNLRPARKLGMKTHKFIDTAGAIAWLAQMFPDVGLVRA